mgnify:CR=1 FL=1
MIDTREKHNKLFVSVKDSGIGIPKDSLKMIFDRFYKTDLSRGKDKKGTGLGLSITKEIIHSHGVGYLQMAAVNYCREHDILVQAWSPLGRRRVLEEPVVLSFAEKYQVTPAQFLLGFLHQEGFSVTKAPDQSLSLHWQKQTRRKISILFSVCSLTNCALPSLPPCCAPHEPSFLLRLKSGKY